MIIKSLQLKNFRNYEEEEIFFSKNINVLVGRNAQGKTNMLEGIFLCAIGKSPRTTKEKELIKWDCTFAKLTLEIQRELSAQKKIEFFIFNNQNKAIKINGFSIKKISQLIGEFNAVYFSPDELKLIKESPQERRKFMDISISQFNKSYFFNLSKYHDILKQRNKLLKTTQNTKLIMDTIDIWNEQLSLYGSKIIWERMAFLEKLKHYAVDIHSYLTDNKEKLELSYVGLKEDSEEKIKEALLSSYKENLEKDISWGFTSTGPHRDDIKILANNIDIRNFGSQGQQRTCALTFKLAELEVFKENIGEYPVLLLDDVLSELDENRQNKLMDKIKNIQTIITCVDFNFNIPATIFTIKDGKL